MTASDGMRSIEETRKVGTRAMHISQGLWFLVALIFGLLANVSIWKLVADVNSRGEESQKFSYLGWYPGKLGRVWEAHRSLVPRSLWRVCVIVSVLLAAFCIGMAASSHS